MDDLTTGDPLASYNDLTISSSSCAQLHYKKITIEQGSQLLEYNR